MQRPRSLMAVRNEIWSSVYKRGYYEHLKLFCSISAVQVSANSKMPGRIKQPKWWLDWAFFFSFFLHCIFADNFVEYIYYSKEIRFNSGWHLRVAGSLSGEPWFSRSFIFFWSLHPPHLAFLFTLIKCFNVILGTVPWVKKKQIGIFLVALIPSNMKVRAWLATLLVRPCLPNLSLPDQTLIPFTKIFIFIVFYIRFATFFTLYPNLLVISPFLADQVGVNSQQAKHLPFVSA